MSSHHGFNASFVSSSLSQIRFLWSHAAGGSEGLPCIADSLMQILTPSFPSHLKWNPLLARFGSDSHVLGSVTRQLVCWTRRLDAAVFLMLARAFSLWFSWDFLTTGFHCLSFLMFHGLPFFFPHWDGKHAGEGVVYGEV